MMNFSNKRKTKRKWGTVLNKDKGGCREGRVTEHLLCTDHHWQDKPSGIHKETRKKKGRKKDFPLGKEDWIGVRQTRHPQVHGPCWWTPKLSCSWSSLKDSGDQKRWLRTAGCSNMWLQWWLCPWRPQRGMEKRRDKSRRCLARESILFSTPLPMLG